MTEEDKYSHEKSVIETTQSKHNGVFPLLNRVTQTCTCTCITSEVHVREGEKRAKIRVREGGRREERRKKGDLQDE